jgi:SAM-dependent methyltransferase
MQPRLIIRRAAAAAGVLPAVFWLHRRLRESSPRFLLANLRSRRSASASGAPVPPGRLLYLASTTRSVPHFLDGGRLAVDALRAALVRVHRPIESAHDVLDFGCGCGRVLRHWPNMPDTKLYGCDYNPKAVAWVRASLPHVTVLVNNLEPPLPFADSSFDIVYALSVFTHLPVAFQNAWIAELHRILRPTGILIITTMGAAYTDRLSPDEREEFAAGNIVTRDESYAGTNLCAVYHSEHSIRNHLAQGFTILDFQPRGALGNVLQDQYVLLREP